MSTSAPFQVPNDLVTEFKASADGNSNISFFEVQVQNEQFVLVTKHAGTGNLKNDFNSFCSGASNNQASFFLYRGNNRKDWTFVTYVPEVPIKERMIYASAKGTLKDKLGHNNFSKELHFTNKNELSYSSVEEADRKIDVRSEFEKTHEKVLQDEEEARDEVAKRQTVSLQNSGGIGGYHSVQIPFSSSASSEIEKVKNGSANLVELYVDDSKSHINAQSAKTVAHNELKNHINTSEPRFYVYSKTAGAFVFIYCCPEKSPQKLRMVYSTSKPSVLDQISKKGIDVSRKAEITEANEIGEALAVASSRKTVNFGAKQSLPEGGGTSKARAFPTVYGASPLASMMQQGGGVSEGATTKKKIVIPPASAW